MKLVPSVTSYKSQAGLTWTGVITAQESIGDVHIHVWRAGSAPIIRVLSDDWMSCSDSPSARRRAVTVLSPFPLTVNCSIESHSTVASIFKRADFLNFYGECIMHGQSLGCANSEQDIYLGKGCSISVYAE